MKNSTFFKITLLIVLSGIVYHVVTPKYQIKNVTHPSLFVSDSRTEISENKPLIRMNRLTGRIDFFFIQYFFV